MFNDVNRGMSYQDTKSSSNDELAAIRLEGKVINTEKATTVESTMNYFIIIFSSSPYFHYLCTVFENGKKKTYNMSQYLLIYL